MNEVNFVTAALAGLVSFLSPCVLPLIPGYISYISGVSLESLRDEEAKTAQGRVFVSSIFFVLGFTVVFVALGASATALGTLLLQKLQILQQIAAVVVIVFGLHLIGLRIPFLQYEKRVEVNKRPLTVFGAFLIGMAFAFGWTPCIGPILAGILGLASTQETILQGMLLLAVYSLGLGVPFLLTSLGIQRFFQFFGVVKRFLRQIEIVSGILLIIIGALMLSGKLVLLAQMFPFLNRFAL